MGMTLQKEWETFISQYPRNNAPVRTYDIEDLERRFPSYIDKLKKDAGSNQPHNPDILLRQHAAECEGFYKASGIELGFDYYVGEFFTGEINAAATMAPSGYFFLINTGMRDVVFKFCKSFIWSSEFVYMHTHTECALPDGYDPEAYSFNAIAGYLARTILIYLWPLPEDLLAKLVLPANEDAAMLFAYTDTSAMAFVIMHEMAHAKLGHLNPDNMKHILSDGNDLLIYNKSQEQEHQADWLAASALYSSENRGRSHYTADESRLALMRVNAVCLLLLGLDLLEECSGVMFNSDVTTDERTHPYPLTRIRLILDLFERQWGEHPLDIFPVLGSTFSWYEEMKPLVLSKIADAPAGSEGLGQMWKCSSRQPIMICLICVLSLERRGRTLEYKLSSSDADDRAVADSLPRGIPPHSEDVAEHHAAEDRSQARGL